MNFNYAQQNQRPGYNPALANPYQHSMPVGNEMDHIVKGIWIGGHKALQKPQMLMDNNIYNVINTAIEFITEKPELIPWQELQNKGIEVYNTMWDDTMIEQIYPGKAMDEAIKRIDSVVQRGGQVLVNCAMGKSRSTSCVVAYLMTRQNMGLEEACALCKSKRNMCSPNPNFMNQLRNMENNLRNGGGQGAAPTSPRVRAFSLGSQPTPNTPLGGDQRWNPGSTSSYSTPGAGAGTPSFGSSFGAGGATSPFGGAGAGAGAGAGGNRFSFGGGAGAGGFGQGAGAGGYGAGNNQFGGGFGQGAQTQFGQAGGAFGSGGGFGQGQQGGAGQFGQFGQQGQTNNQFGGGYGGYSGYQPGQYGSLYSNLFNNNNNNSGFGGFNRSFGNNQSSGFGGANTGFGGGGGYGGFGQQGNQQGGYGGGQGGFGQGSMYDSFKRRLSL